MNKQEFLSRLEEALACLPREERMERLAFYRESIDDRMETGLTEEAAVAELGPVEEIASQILSDSPLPDPVVGKMPSRPGMQVWEILLLVLGFPLWFPLLIAAFVLLLSGYIVLWSLILCLWAVELSLLVSGLGAFFAGLLSLFRGDLPEGLFLIGAGLVLTGFSVILFFACKAASKGAAVLSRKLALWVKSLFLRKENEA